eukprot:11631640-Ditylum_brightwellii.AAC.1
MSNTGYHVVLQHNRYFCSNVNFAKFQGPPQYCYEMQTSGSTIVLLNRIPSNAWTNIAHYDDPTKSSP